MNPYVHAGGGDNNKNWKQEEHKGLIPHGRDGIAGGNGMDLFSSFFSIQESDSCGCLDTFAVEKGHG